MPAPIPSPAALGCAAAAAVLAASAVAHQRIGLALTGVLLTLLAAGALPLARVRSRPALAIAVALALQPVVRDAAWVVAVAVAGALPAGAAAVVEPRAWAALRAIVAAPWRFVAGGSALVRAAAALLPTAKERPWAAVARGVALGGGLAGGFAVLFAAADPAFARLASDALAVEADTDELVWRGVLGVAVLGVGAALAVAPRPARERGRPARVPGRTELVIALGTVLVVFSAFIAVQVRVLFGGSRYVEATTGLGYGEYARQGFGVLLVVAGCTLALVGFAARRTDRAVRGLLGALCVLTLLVLASAHHRLDLVEDAYGFTRTRFGGHAVVLWLAAVLLVVLAAGARSRIAAAAPRAVTQLTLGGALAFCLVNPDARIAERNVARFEAGGDLDGEALASLSADALPVLERLPARRHGWIAEAVRRDLARPDGLAGFNLARASARRR